MWIYPTVCTINPDIKWNFTKFLIDKSGKVVRRFEPTDDIKSVEASVAELLKKQFIIIYKNLSGLMRCTDCYSIRPDYAYDDYKVLNHYLS